MQQVKSICICGGGLAGWMTAVMLHSGLKEKVDISIIYDPSAPPVGAGESTTPIFRSFMRWAGITFEEIIKEADGTFKTGIHFEDWIKGESYWHNFNAETPEFNAVYKTHNAYCAYEVITDTEAMINTYDPEIIENYKVPVTDNPLTGDIKYSGNVAVHFDAALLPKLLRKKLGDKIKVIEGNVSDVKMSEGDSPLIEAVKVHDQWHQFDFFFDCTGLKRYLIQKFSPKWESAYPELMINRAMVCPVMTDAPKKAATIATAMDHGWIWQVPLQNRYGTGYCYNSELVSDDEIQSDFAGFLNQRYGVKPQDFRVIPFDVGAYEKPWQGNCIAIGLASGFYEPIEATNIHIVIPQVTHFIRSMGVFYTPSIVNHYNIRMREINRQIKDIIKLHYYTKRTDNEFWRQASKVSGSLSERIEMIRQTFLTMNTISFGDDYRVDGEVFGMEAWNSIAKGLKLFDKERIREVMAFYNINLAAVKKDYQRIYNNKQKIAESYVNHWDMIQKLRAV